MDDGEPETSGAPPPDAASVVLPVPRVGDGVLSTVERYLEAARELPLRFELILVIPRVEAGAISAFSMRHPEVRVVELDDWSWGRAVRRGLAESSEDILLYTNLNRTSVETLTLMLSYALIYRGVVLKANRRTRDSVAQRLGSLLYNAECWSLFNLVGWDVNGTPKIFPRSCTRLLELTHDDDLIDAEFMLVCRREGYPLLEVPISALAQAWDWPRSGFRDAARMYAGAFRMWRGQRSAAQ